MSLNNLSPLIIKKNESLINVNYHASSLEDFYMLVYEDKKFRLEIIRQDNPCLNEIIVSIQQYFYTV